MSTTFQYISSIIKETASSQSSFGQFISSLGVEKTLNSLQLQEAELFNNSSILTNITKFLTAIFNDMVSRGGIIPDFKNMVPEYDSFWTHPFTPIFGIIIFSVTVIALRLVMNLLFKKPFELKFFNILHNAFLTLFSAFITLALIYDLSLDSIENGFNHTICDMKEIVVNSRAFFWCYLFYISKYYEFVDTFILVLRKKPLSFLHVYHHAATAFVVYLLIVGRVSMTWQLAILNSFIHTVMYFYYTLALFGIQPWWKKFITTGQIVQFLILLSSACYLQIYLQAIKKLDCSGNEFAFWLGFGFVVSLVFLFANFYKKSYKNRPDKSKSIENRDNVKKEQ